jgi:hypothetical protein
VQPVETAQPDVGNQQVVGIEGEKAFRGVVRRGAGDHIPGIAQKVDDPRQRGVVVVQDEDSIG